MSHASWKITANAMALEMKPINVGLLGIGTVGGGTYTVLTRNEAEITRRAGRPIRISVVAEKNLALAQQVTASKVRILEADRGGRKPSYTYHEKPKSINTIKPEDVVKNVCELLNVPYTKSINTKFIGELYSQAVVEIIA